MPPDETTLRDCRASTLLAQRTAHKRVLACGELWSGSMPVEKERTYRCIADAVANSRPFVFHETLPGADSAIERGVLGLTKNGAFVTYSLRYDSNPCGGGCPQNGGTSIVECRPLTPIDPIPADCSYDILDCFDCKDRGDIERCRRGDREGASR